MLRKYGIHTRWSREENDDFIYKRCLLWERITRGLRVLFFQKYHKPTSSKSYKFISEKSLMATPSHCANNIHLNDKQIHPQFPYGSPQLRHSSTLSREPQALALLLLCMIQRNARAFPLNLRNTSNSEYPITSSRSALRISRREPLRSAAAALPGEILNL